MFDPIFLRSVTLGPIRYAVALTNPSMNNKIFFTKLWTHRKNWEWFIIVARPRNLFASFDSVGLVPIHGFKAMGKTWLNEI